MSQIECRILMFLYGTHDEHSSLHVLCGNKLVISKILDDVKHWFYDGLIDRTSTAYLNLHDGPGVFQNPFTFPASSGLHINMMPIKIFDDDTIPDHVKQYTNLIRRCIINKYTDRDKIVYLTIDESSVPVGTTQRRPGLHIERPRKVTTSSRTLKSPTTTIDEYYKSEYYSLAWGCGKWLYGELPVDGIYMMSNLDNSCRIYPNLIDDPEMITDDHGGCECLRNHLDEGENLQANTVYWMTDRTPHEALPVQASTPNSQAVDRQFLRIVAGRISVWYSKHNTPNPCGLLPDAPISDDDKFFTKAEHCHPQVQYMHPTAWIRRLYQTYSYLSALFAYYFQPYESEEIMEQ